MKHVKEAKSKEKDHKYNLKSQPSSTRWNKATTIILIFIAALQAILVYVGIRTNIMLAERRKQYWKKYWEEEKMNEMLLEFCEHVEDIRIFYCFQSKAGTINATYIEFILLCTMPSFVEIEVVALTKEKWEEYNQNAKESVIQIRYNANNVYERKAAMIMSDLLSQFIHEGRWPVVLKETVHDTTVRHISLWMPFSDE